MVRTSVPGGVLSAEQWLALDALTDKLANGTLRITTRQGIQFHFVAKDGCGPSSPRSTSTWSPRKGACGDIVRNVVACPAPARTTAARTSCSMRPACWPSGSGPTPAPTTSCGSTASRRPPPRPDRQPGAIGAARRSEPLYGETYLPRKFKIGLAWPGDNCIDVYSQDVGVVPHDGG